MTYEIYFDLAIPGTRSKELVAVDLERGVLIELRPEPGLPPTGELRRIMPGAQGIVPGYIISPTSRVCYVLLNKKTTYI